MHAMSGDASCRDCHPGESAAPQPLGSFEDPAIGRSGRPQPSLGRSDGRGPERPGVAWTYHLRDGQLVTERTEPGQATAERSVLEYAFGSGRHAVTFVSMLDRNPDHPTSREHRLTFFAHSGSTDVTPGQFLTGHASGNTDRGRIPLDREHAELLPMPHDGDFEPWPGGAGRGHDDPQRDRASDATVRDNPTLRRPVAMPAPATMLRAYLMASKTGPSRSNSANAEPATARPRWSSQARSGRITRSWSGTSPSPWSSRLASKEVRTRSAASTAMSLTRGPRPIGPPMRSPADPVTLTGVWPTVPSRQSPAASTATCRAREVARGMIMTDHWIRIIPGLGSPIPGPGPGRAWESL